MLFGQHVNNNISYKNILYRVDLLYAQAYAEGRALRQLLSFMAFRAGCPFKSPLLLRRIGLRKAHNKAFRSLFLLFYVEKTEFF